MMGSQNELCCEKTCLQAFETRFNSKQAVLSQKMARDLKFQILVEDWDWTFYVGKTKVLITCMVIAQLICAFVFRISKKQIFLWRCLYIR